VEIRSNQGVVEGKKRDGTARNMCFGKKSKFEKWKTGTLDPENAVVKRKKRTNGSEGGEKHRSISPRKSSGGKRMGSDKRGGVERLFGFAYKRLSLYPGKKKVKTCVSPEQGGMSKHGDV